MNADSVKARLKNYAKETGETMQSVLGTYGIERTLYRISISHYAEKFTLKGGILLYALFEGKFSRVTTDMDLLARGISNNKDEIEDIFREIFSKEEDDALRFDIKTLNVKTIAEFKKYQGINVSLLCFLDKTEIKISLDIGFGDIIYPSRTRIEFPVLLEMEEPILYAYSTDTVIAEKFEAIVQLGYANSRYKDFYDIYMLARNQTFEGMILKQAIKETFYNRNTNFTDIVAFEDDFAKDKMRQARWEAFTKKKKTTIKIGFEEALETIKVFLLPIVKSINDDSKFEYDWDNENMKWL